MLLNKRELEKLIIASSIYGTGGGISVDEQLNSLNKLNDNIQIKIKTLSEFDENSYIAQVGEIGPASAPEIEKEHIIKEMVYSIEKLTDKKIVGFYAPEIGQEIVSIKSSYYSNIPLVDFESAGFRAVPYIDACVFNVLEIPHNFAPAAISTFQREIFLFNSKISFERTEEIVREITNISEHNIVFSISDIVRVGDIKKYNIDIQPYKKIMDISDMNFSDFIKNEKIKNIFQIKIDDIDEYDKNGFNVKVVYSGDIAITFMNEAMFIKSNDKLLYSVPDRILLIRNDKMQGIHIKEIVKGMELCVVVIEPIDYWNTARGKQILGYDRIISTLT
ncbi:MAG: DUF917 domain-containing protein [Rickettsiales bacterium]|jgi:DUF917 family protein|nr:DUF917 domain-containing protein [Rickettsiales bacterium]